MVFYFFFIKKLDVSVKQFYNKFLGFYFSLLLCVMFLSFNPKIVACSRNWYTKTQLFAYFSIMLGLRFLTTLSMNKFKLEAQGQTLQSMMMV